MASRQPAHPPLSAAQQGIWLGQRLDPASSTYNAAQRVALRADANVEALVRAIRQASSEVDVLRATIAAGEDGGPHWELERHPTVELAIAHANSAAEVDAMVTDHCARPFDLAIGPLSRHLVLISHRGLDWVLCAHHVALDGLGFSLLVQRAAELYTAEARGGQAPAARFVSLQTSLRESEAYAASEARRADADFWRGYLSGPQAPASLAPSAALASATPRRASFLITPVEKRALDVASRSAAASWPAALAAGIAALVTAEASATQAPRVALALTGRSPATLRSPAMAMNIGTLRLDLEPSRTFRDAIACTKQEMDRVRPHERYRHEWLRRELGLLGAGRRLFGPVLNIQPFPQRYRFGDQHGAVHTLRAGPVEDLSVSVVRDGGGLAITMEANSESYSEAQLASHAEAFHTLLRRAGASPGSSVRALTAPPAAKTPIPQTADCRLHGAPLERPADDVMRRLRAHADTRAKHVALRRGPKTLTYRELHTRVQDLARRLRSSGIDEQSRVAVALPRGIEAVTVILAVMEAGASYVPIDLEGPSERNAAVLADAGPAIVIARETERASLALHSQVLCLEQLESSPPDASLPKGSSLAADAEREAYLLYTSGSTGVPAGVRVSRGALSHFAEAARQAYALREDDRVLQLAPLQFDTSVEEIFVTLTAGATLVLRSADRVDSLHGLLQDCEREDISVLDLPTALWHELVFHLLHSQQALPHSLRTVIIGGEAAQAERVRQWHSIARGNVRLLNTYGPTEATVVATHAELRHGEPAPRVSIGRPLPGTSAVVIDDTGAPVPPGGSGELWLMGPQLALGYLNQPERDQRRFVNLDALPGRPRAYRTGDLVRASHDGTLEFVGRVDDEAKISGHRVFPPAVEAVLLQHALVREAAVVAVPNGCLGPRLAAFVVWHAQGEEHTDALRAHAKRWLAGPAIPSEVLSLPRLPRTTTGKVDRRALVDAAQLAEPARVPAEESPLCGVVLACLAEALGCAIEADDNFFDRGGQSLQAIQAANLLARRLAREVPAALLFRSPNARALSEALQAGQTRVTDRATPVEQLIADAWLPDSVRRSAATASIPPKHVLLTGATGFVGAHLLQALLAHTDTRVTCLVRAEADSHAAERVQHTLREHGIEVDSRRVSSLSADLTKPRLELSETHYAHLAQSCDAVLHCAASVSVVRDYASVRASNVDATRQLLEFACDGPHKAFHLVSTLAAATTAGRASVLERVSSEPPAMRDGYCESKWVAEHLVQAARARGVLATIHRLGRVLGAQSGGANPQDILFRMLALGLPKGWMPSLDLSEPWVGVDYAAAAIAAMVRHGDLRSAAHNIAPYPPVALSDVLEWAEGHGYPHARCAPEHWADALGRVPQEHRPTLAFFEAQANHQTPVLPQWTFETKAFRKATTRVALPELPTPRDLFCRTLDAAVERGWLPPPSPCPSSPGALDAH